MTLSRAQLATISAGCAAGVLFALIGAAQAVDAARTDAELIEKGDRIGTASSPIASVTVEEVNFDIGVSNLIRIEQADASP
jgi:hypothetical protein